MDRPGRVAKPIAAVCLRAFDRERDTHRLQEWLGQPHVAPWWGDPRAAMDDALRRSSETCAVILADDVPVGYACWQLLSPEERGAAGLIDLPEHLMDIDLLVGEPGAVGLGVGPRALGLVLDRLRAEPRVPWAGVGTAVANKRAIRAFEKAGFRLFREFRDREFGLCWYLTLDLGGRSAARRGG